MAKINHEIKQKDQVKIIAIIECQKPIRIRQCRGVGSGTNFVVH